MSLRFRFCAVAGAAIVVSVLALPGLAGGNATAAAAATSAPTSPAVSGTSPAASQAETMPAATPTGLPAGTQQDCPRPASLLQEQCQLFTRSSASVQAALRAAGTGTTSPAQPGLGLTAANLQDAYGLTAAAATGGVNPETGTPETVAIVDAYNSVAEVTASLPTYRSEEDLPACDTATGAGCVTVFNENGNASPLPKVSVTGWEDETILDVEMVSAICPNCHIDLFEANTANLPDMGTAENSAAKVAKFISNSWSGNDFPGESAFDALYFNHPGVAITVASGDYGYGAGYPASSQLVTSVGGTYLAPSGSSRGWSEVVWSGQGTGTGSGTAAGCSSGEPEPAWQPDADGSQALKWCANRTENDVAAAASAPNGIALYSTASDCAGWCEAFGTSVATPIIAATYALAGTPTPDTYPSSYLYQHPADFFHITSGSDGTCEASRLYLCNAADSLSDGYNGPTGLGTPDGIAGFENSSAMDIVSVINPGTYDLQAGLHYSLPAIKAYDSATGQVLTYSASGLPSGLSINPATGAISGQLPAAAPASALVHVTVKDGTGASSTVSFDIVAVKSLTSAFHAVSGPVRLDLGGKCLDDSGNSSAAGAKTVIWSCNGSAAQDWEFIPGSAPGAAGSIRIHGKCLSTTASAQIALAACGAGSSQQWELTGANGALENPASGGCLDDPGSSKANGKQLDIAACTGGDNQAWVLPASPITSGVTGKCADVNGDSAKNGTAIVSYSCNGSAAQRITLGLNSTLQVNGKCLDVTDQGTKNGYTVVLETCDGSASQIWEVSAFGMLENANAEKCLADPVNSTANGRELEIQDCYGLAGEVWALS